MGHPFESPLGRARMLNDGSAQAPMAPSPEWPLEERLAGAGRQRLVGPGRAPPAQDATAAADERCEPAWPAPRRWGRSAEAVAPLGDRLSQCWRRLRGGCTPRTRATSAHAYDDRRAQWPLDTARTLANLDRPLHGGEGPALQHCMANSPWAGHVGCSQRQAALQAIPALAHGSPLLLEESAAENAGTHHAGAARQYNGRRGQGEVGRVDTCLPSANGGLGALVAGELCVPAEGWGAALAQRRTELGLPAARRFETKLHWGVKRLKRVQGQGWPFALRAGDALDGRDSPLRAAGDAAGVRYAAQGPAAPYV